MNHTQTITDIRHRLGDQLVIMAHHYQRDEVVQHGDFAGDSLELARRIPDSAAREIVFCGVHFMAESAAVLAGPGRRVTMPAPDAGCTMANMAPAVLLEAVLARLTATGRKVVPLSYVNTSAAVKAVTARFGGSVCTSANAETMLRWAMDQGDGVLFVPDKNLSRNTAARLGIPESRRHRVDIRSGGARVDMAAASGADLLYWPGCCCVHEVMGPERVLAARRAHPDALVAVHPECPPETVAISDMAGSTSQLINYVDQAPEGSTIFIGTEINLVRRLGHDWEGRKDVRPLMEVPCRQMGKNTEANLAALLQNLDAAEPVTVADDVIRDARLALDRMLEACR